MTNKLLSLIKTAASVRFRGQAPRIWYYCFDDEWQAIIINSVNKKILCRSSIRKTKEEALDNLKSKIQISVIKRTNDLPK